MKELSVEDKAKRYDEAIERAKEINREHSKKGFKPSDDVLYIFPELKESEDERIRNLLYCLIRDRSDNRKLLENNGVSVGMALAWIEKQSQTFTKKDVDDAYLKGICDAKQELEKQGDKKEDVTRAKIAEYLKKLILDQSQRGAHMLDYEGRIEEEVDFIISIVKKELKIEKQDKQKPAKWSEEDESNLDSAIYYIRREPYRESDVEPIVNWLRNLKERVQFEQKWSEKDEEMIKYFDELLDYAFKNWSKFGGKATSALEWLELLKDKYTWKPSKKQIIALRWILNNIPYCSYKEEISGLLDQIKDL